jgi:hypothetical protein
MVGLSNGIAEKAMATLSTHPLMIPLKIMVSPYPSPTPLPYPQHLTPARYIRPKRSIAPPLPVDDNAMLNFMAHCPTPGELFDAVRPWGSLRSISVWADRIGPEEKPSWGARVEFWYGDEARMFEVGFGQTGSLMKGWQL